MINFILAVAMLFVGSSPETDICRQGDYCSFLPIVQAQLCDPEIPVEDCFMWIDPPRGQP